MADLICNGARDRPNPEVRKEGAGGPRPAPPRLAALSSHHSPHVACGHRRDRLICGRRKDKEDLMELA